MKKELELKKDKSYDDNYIDELIKQFWLRYNNRYFNQIEELINHKKKEIRTNCGFLITSIDCILIETLEQFYAGTDESKINTQVVYQTFFNRDENLKKIIRNQKEAGKFAGLVRSGLLHQAKTKIETKINIKKDSPILGWIDENNTNKGFIINRNLFHKHVKQEFENYVERLRKPEESLLRERFVDKMKSL